MAPSTEESIQSTKRKAEKAAEPSQPAKTPKLDQVENALEEDAEVGTPLILHAPIDQTPFQDAPMEIVPVASAEIAGAETNNIVQGKGDVQMSRTVSPVSTAQDTHSQQAVIKATIDKGNNEEQKKSQTPDTSKATAHPSSGTGSSTQQTDNIVSSGQSSAKPRKRRAPYPCFEDDRTKDMRTYFTLQQDLEDCIPKQYLAPHRCWIAVIDGDKRVSKSSSEKTVLWMKGNRFITAETVMRYYETATLSEEVVLLLVRDKIDPKTTMEELFINNERLVVFRAFLANRAYMYAQRLTQNLIPAMDKPDEQSSEIIEID